MSDQKPEKERLSFEDALQKLQRIVSKLEDENTSLDDSIALYEEGLKLSKMCSEKLETARLRIEQIDKDFQ